LDVLTTTSSRRYAWTAVIIFFLVVYLGSAFAPGLQDDVDSSHAEVSREMLTRGDFVTLHVNGFRYLEKAPMIYWLVAGCYTVFGVNEFSTRLPNAFAMLLLALLAMRWARRAYGARASVYAGLFIATTAGCFLFTRIMIPEAILSLFIACSFYCFLTALEDRDTWRWYGGYACLALAVLTKGLLALVVVGFAMLLYIAFSGEWRRWREFRIATGLLLFFVIAAPWHILAGLRNPAVGYQHHGFFWFYFVNEHFMRFLGKRIPKDYNKQQSSLFWGLHLIWLFPWSLYLPVALRRLIADFRQRRAQSTPAPATFRQRTDMACIIWAGVTLVFFSFSTNQEYYTFPAYLPILLFIAGQLAREEESTSRRWLLWTSAVLAVVSVAFAAILVFGLWSSRHLAFVPDIGTVLAKPDLQADSLSMGHILDLTGESFAALRLPAILAAFALGLGPALAFWLRRRRAHFYATWMTALTMVVFLLAAHIALGRFDPYLGSRNMAREIAPILQPSDRVMIYGDQSFGSTLLFYLKRPIEVVNGATTTLWFGSTFPDAPHILLDDAGLLKAWNSPQNVYLFVPQHENAHVEALLHPSRMVAQSSGKVIYANHP